MKLRFLLVVVAAFAISTEAYAHHSFSAEFDGTKPVRLVGKLTRVEWTNPHSYFYIDVVDKNGNVTNWGCEGCRAWSTQPTRVEEGRS